MSECMMFALILLCLFCSRGRSGREEVVNMPFRHPVTVMQCDVTTNVADAITNVGNPNESSEMLSNYRGGTTASARVRYKHFEFWRNHLWSSGRKIHA